MLPELPGDGVAKSTECSAAFIAALNPAASRRSKSDVPARWTHRARFTMVVVAARNDATVDVQYELGGDRAVSRL